MNRLQAERNASEELRELVGTPWILGAVTREAGGLDCIGLMVEAFTIIGRHLDEEAIWRFPIPLGYPYPAELPDGSWLPEEDLADWARHFDPLAEPAFGLAVTMNADHIGVLIHAAAGRGFDVLHSHRSSGVGFHPYARVAQWATGFYRLRTEARELAR